MTASANPASTPPVIITDSTCDLPAALVQEYNIRMVPLVIQFGTESYQSGVDMHLAEFAERLAVGDVHPTTSQPTVHDFQTLYESLPPDQPVLSIHLSAGLSGTFNAAQQAANALPDRLITVHDSGTISAALGMQVLMAARAVQAGYSTEQILPLLAETHAATDLLFVMDDLSYLVRGGRIGRVQYRVAQTLNIKPIITVAKTGDEAGTYTSIGRVRKLDRAVDYFVKDIIKRHGEGATLRVMTFHGIGPTPGLAARLLTDLGSHFNLVLAERAPSTPVLGVHVGPHALDIGFAVGDWPV